MKIPESIVKKIDELEQKKRDRKDAARRERGREKKVADALKKMRKERAPELVQAAEVVAEWMSKFYGSAEGQRILEIVGSVKIFCAAYWLGLPVPEAHMTTFATITLNNRGRVIYGERYKGFLAPETCLDRVPCNPMVLVEALHPDYLVALAEHLTSGAVWECIEGFLPKNVY